ncbi:MAG: FCD domain-containing protein [Actinobacteria bacterium]|nr:FCD domain-containing protein [Actinomycetota bacterium]
MSTNQESLSRRTTSEEVAARLRDEILRAELAPGTRLRQGAMAKRFGVSTTPVREAFTLLQAEGLVRIDPHRGAIVFLPSVKDVREYYEIREALESLAIALALPNLDDDTLDELQALVARMRVEEDESAWAEMNERFHRTIYEASDRPRLTSMIATLRDASKAYIHMYVARQNPATRSNDDHQRILDACRSRNAKRARASISHHMRHTASELAAFIQRSEKQIAR